MFEDLIKHPIHFIFLILWLLLCAVLFMMLPHVFLVRISILVIGVFGYIAWGIWHHMMHEDLSFLVVVEYLLSGMLALVMMIFVLYNS